MLRALRDEMMSILVGSLPLPRNFALMNMNVGRILVTCDRTVHTVSTAGDVILIFLILRNADNDGRGSGHFSGLTIVECVME